jgi:hypothetical protein
VKRKLPTDLWIVLFLIVFFLGSGYFAMKRQADDIGMDLMVRRTTYSSKRHGLKGLYETLDKLGYPTERLLHPLTSVPHDGVLFVVSPEKIVTKYERLNVRKWVEKGNLLVVSGDTGFLADMETGAKTARSKPCTPSFLARGVSAYTTEADAHMRSTCWDFDDFIVFGTGFG